MKNKIYRYVSYLCFMIALLFFIKLQTANVGYTVQYGLEFCTFAIVGAIMHLIDVISNDNDK